MLTAREFTQAYDSVATPPLLIDATFRCSRGGFFRSVFGFRPISLDAGELQWRPTFSPDCRTRNEEKPRTDKVAPLVASCECSLTTSASALSVHILRPAAASLSTSLPPATRYRFESVPGEKNRYLRRVFIAASSAAVARYRFCVCGRRSVKEANFR